MRIRRLALLTAAFAVGSAGALGGVGIGQALAQEPARQDGRKHAPNEIQRLVTQLASADFQAREAAEKALVRFGRSAIPALQAAALSGDAETRRRARRALARIHARLEENRRALPGPDDDPQAAPQPGPRRPGARGQDPFAPPKGWQRLPKPRARDPFAQDPMLRDLWKELFGGADPFGPDFLKELDQELDRAFRQFGLDPNELRPPRRERRPGEPGDLFGDLNKTLEDLLKNGGLRFRFAPQDPELRKELERAQREAEKRMRELFGPGGFGGGFGGGFEGFEKMLERARKQAELFRKRAQGRGGAGGGMFRPDGASRSFSMGPNGMTVTMIEGGTKIVGTKNADGLKLTVTEPDANGKPSTRTWSAADEAELRRAHPEAAKFWDRAMGGIHINPGRGGFLFGGGRPPVRPRPQPTHPASRSNALGITTRALSEGLRTQLELAAGQGLYVSRVEPRSWAAANGIRAHDVIVSAAGEPVGSVSALAKIRDAATGEFTIQAYRFGEKVTLSAKR